jgi:DNA-binding GntR family transcriptional regulator
MSGAKAAKTGNSLKATKSADSAGGKRRAADIAYDRLEGLFATLRLPPDAPVVEVELAEQVGLGRTPVREALMRMVSVGLILQQPRRGLRVSPIDLLNHLDLLQTRRALERLIAASAARRATAPQRKAIVAAALQMADAAARGKLDGYMAADQALDHVVHAAARNASAAQAVEPLVVQCRRFWYAYQREGDLGVGARCHRLLAEGIESGEPERAVAGADALMDYLERFARRVIEA